MKVPEDPAEFASLMMGIDRELASSGYSIPQRPINAVRLVSDKFGIPLPITKPPPGMEHEATRFWPISNRVYQWYDSHYGERIKMDFAIGRMAILIEEDIWILRIPHIYGSVAFTVSRSFQSEKIGSGGKPARYNVVDAVEDMPKAKVVSLPDNELEHIYEKFMLGIRGFSILDGTPEHSLLDAASGDISAAVNHLTAQVPQYGQSKWSSLQAAEKSIKAAISLNGGSFSNTHNLAKLSEEARSVGIKGEWSMLTGVIQCSAGIRYGEEACNRDQAILAHNATLGLVIHLSEGGAKFKSSLAISTAR